MDMEEAFMLATEEDDGEVINEDLLPMSTEDINWISSKVRQVSVKFAVLCYLPSKRIMGFFFQQKYINFDMEMNGAWLLFYDNENADEAWIKARTLFNDDKLTGVWRVRVSTLKESPNCSNKMSKVR